MEKEYAISYGIENIKVFLSKIRLNNFNRNYLSIVLKKIINCTYISEKYKYNIKGEFKDILLL